MMNSGKYLCLVVDPPWSYDKGGPRIRPFYRLLSLGAIKNFPIHDFAAKDSHCYLWVTNSFIGEGLEIMRHWGFEYKTMLTWVKTRLGMGSWFRGATEHVLFGVKGKLPLLRKDLPTWFFGWQREHSRKPDSFYELVEKASPGPRIDIFSREKRPGWDQWGDQCDMYQSNYIPITQIKEELNYGINAIAKN